MTEELIVDKVEDISNRYDPVGRLSPHFVPSVLIRIALSELVVSGQLEESKSPKGPITAHFGKTDSRMCYRRINVLVALAKIGESIDE